MAVIVHVPQANTVTITAVSATARSGLSTTQRYRLLATTACWVAQGATPTAAIGGASGSQYVPANVPVDIDGVDGAVLAVIGTSGTLTITPMDV